MGVEKLNRLKDIKNTKNTWIDKTFAVHSYRLVSNYFTMSKVEHIEWTSYFLGYYSTGWHFKPSKAVN